MLDSFLVLPLFTYHIFEKKSSTFYKYPFFQNVWLVIAFFVMLLSNALTYLFQIYGLSSRFKKHIKLFMKYLLLPPVWGVILFHVFIKKKIISAQMGPPTIYSLESEGIMKFSHFKMHIVRIDKLCFILKETYRWLINSLCYPKAGWYFRVTFGLFS